MMEQVADDKRGRRAIEWTRDNRQQQINNQPLMGVTKAGGDTAVKAKAALLVNGAPPLRGSWRHWKSWRRQQGGRRQQWQLQSGNNQLNVMVTSGGVDSRGDGGKQWRSTVIGSKTPMAKVINIAFPTPLLSLLAGGGGRAAVAAATE
jgi:hypothetical protein